MIMIQVRVELPHHGSWESRQPCNFVLNEIQGTCFVFECTYKHAKTEGKESVSTICLSLTANNMQKTEKKEKEEYTFCTS